jgi:hypothetical protein
MRSAIYNLRETETLLGLGKNNQKKKVFRLSSLRSRTLNFKHLKIAKSNKKHIFGRPGLINCKMLSIDRFDGALDSNSSGLPHRTIRETLAFPQIFGASQKKKNL